MVPFKVDWSKAQFETVKERIAACPLPPAPVGAGWTLGCDADFLARFRDYWLRDYDLEAALERLNRYPQFVAPIDGFDIHFVHVKGEGTGNRPLLMTHGWPGSHLEFFGLIDRLTRPSAHGGRAEDAFDVVLPSLPGYGFSAKPDQPVGPAWAAAKFDRLMTEALGYGRYLAQGGDWGSVVTSMLGLNHADHVASIHLNMLALRSPEKPADDAERAWLEASMEAQARFGGYQGLQRSKPMSLAYATAGNPLGVAAWILERFHDWSDRSQGEIDAIFGMDELIDNIMVYVMTDSFPTSVMF